METQVNQLKLNVTNINSYLINSNKQLTKLRKDKKNLFGTLEKKKELRAEESRLESKNLKIGSGFSKIAGAISTPARSIFDKILEFFGLIALGVLVQKLPEIITKINQFFESDAFKSIKSMFSTLAKGVDFLIDLTTTNVDEKKLKDEGKTITKESEKLKKASEEINSKKAEYEKIKSDLEKSKSSKPEPPSGTGGPLGGSIPKVQKRAQGGTIDNKTNTSPTYTPRKSGPLKYAEKGMESGFNGFSQSVDKIEEYSKKEEENMLAFAEMSENFKKWSSLSGISTTSPYGSVLYTGQSQRPQRPQRPQTPPRSVPSGVTIDVTGEPGVDFTPAGSDVRALFDGVVVADPLGTNHQFNPARQRGYGNFMIIRHKDPDTGDEFDALYAHFPDQNFPKPGASVKKGDILGKMGTLNDPIEQRGSIDDTHMSVDFYPKGGPYSRGSAYKRWTSIVGHVDPTFGGSKISGAKLKGRVYGPGGGRDDGRSILNTSNKGGNQSLFVYAVQPIETFVPFPYPVPIETASSSPAPSKPRVPSGWRA